jgi:sortase A
MRRLVRWLGTLLVVGGVSLLVWAGATWAWEDPFTSVYTQWQQRELAGDYERRAEAFEARPALVSSGLGTVAARYRKGLRPGEAIGRLRVPRLGVDMLFVEGTDSESLKKGPGRYRKSFLPGEGELVYIAGHRTSYAAPFSRIDRLRRGDLVVVDVPYGTFRYRITGHRIVKADEVSVLRSRHREVVALQACHPRFFASHRIIAYAKPAKANVGT